MKKMRKLLALVLSLAMVFGMATVVSAAYTPQYDDEGNLKAWLSKTFNTEVGMGVTFGFTATQDKTEGDDYEDADMSLTIADISFESTDIGSTTKVSQLVYPKYNAAGIYKYTVKENSTVTGTIPEAEGKAKMIMSKAEYEVLVYVQYDEGEGRYEVTAVHVTQTKDDDGSEILDGQKIGDIGPGTEGEDKNNFNFTNTYVYEAGIGEDPENPDENYTENGAFKVSKTVENASDEDKTSKEFEFTATFTFPAGTDKNTLGGINAEGVNGFSHTSDKIDGGLNQSVYTFKLKHEGSVKITGLPVGTIVDIDETANKNYKPSAEITMNGVGQSGVVAEGYEDPLDVNDQELGKAKNTIDVTNTGLVVPPTGVIINVLPFALMLLLGCGALFLFVFTKTRRSSER